MNSQWLNWKPRAYMSIDVWDMQWSDLGRGRLKKIKVHMKSSLSSVCQLGTCPRILTRGYEDVL